MERAEAAGKETGVTDILKLISDEGAEGRDPHGHLSALEAWSEEIARRRAGEEGLELTTAHWEVIRFLRAHFREHGPAAHNARSLRQQLEERAAAAGGRKRLYALFPKGPVTQGSRLAGLPVPTGAVDPSFGTAL